MLCCVRFKLTNVRPRIKPADEIFLYLLVAMRHPLILSGSFSFWASFQTVIRRSSVEKVFFKKSQNSEEKTCARVSFLIKLFIKKETLAQVFFCEFCEISKKILFYRTPTSAASGIYVLEIRQWCIIWMARRNYYNLIS